MPENHQYRLKLRPPGENPSNEPPTTVMSTPGEISGLACCCVTSGITTMPINGLSAAVSSAIRPPALRSWSANSPNKSRSPRRRRSPRRLRQRRRNRHCSPASPTTRCSAMACRPNGLMRYAGLTRTRCSTLPSGCRKRLLKRSSTSRPALPLPERIPAEADPFTHPDAQRRFRVLTNIEELERALDYPWEKWAVFLHPAQRGIVERDYGGPPRISGSAGTGKTIVALHRAVALARRHPDAQVLLTTFSKALANALRLRLHILTDNETRTSPTKSSSTGSPGSATVIYGRVRSAQIWHRLR